LINFQSHGIDVYTVVWRCGIVINIHLRKQCLPRLILIPAPDKVYSIKCIHWRLSFLCKGCVTCSTHSYTSVLKTFQRVYKATFKLVLQNNISLFCLCCHIMCLYVLSSVLRCALRYPHKSDIRFVFTSSCL
jgi:hypothetical protein